MLNKKIIFAAWASSNKNWFTYPAFNNPLKKLFKEVVTFDPQKIIQEQGKAEMNKRFLEVVKKEKPDYIFFWFMYDEFSLDTFVELNKIVPNVITFSYNGDDDSNFENYSIRQFPFIDYFLVTQPEYLKRYEKYGAKPFFACGTDTDKFEYLNIKSKYDVGFVGTAKIDRISLMRTLLKKGINFAVGGSGWDNYPEFKNNYIGKPDNEQFTKLINESKINLCFSKNYFNKTHILERFFQINACRGFCLTEYAEGYFPKFKENEDIVTFKEEKDLIEKIDFYLEKEKLRKTIALKAHNKTRKEFDNTYLLKKALDYMEKYGKRKEVSFKLAKNKFYYFNIEDLSKSKQELTKILAEYEYVCFKHKSYVPLEYKDYFQINSLELTKKDICLCDTYYGAPTIGNYSSIVINNLYDLEDKSYFYDNINLAQLMVRKEYFLNNTGRFLKMSKGIPPKFINKENSTFISFPLLSTTSIPKKLPDSNLETVFITLFEEKIMVLRNKKQLFSSSYLYHLILYSFFKNPFLIKYLIKTTLKRSKNYYLIRLSNFLSQYFIN